VGTIGTQVGKSFWEFEAALPAGKTTTIFASSATTEPCQTNMFWWTGHSISVPADAKDPSLYIFGAGPGNLAEVKDGAYTLTLKDETGQAFSYTVYVNNGNPPVCPEPTPSPEPSPTPAPPGGGGGNGGGNGGGGGSGNEPCACSPDGFSVLNKKTCPSDPSACRNSKINAKPIEIRNKERCRTGTHSVHQKEPDFKLFNVYDFDKGSNKPDMVFVFIKGRKVVNSDDNPTGRFAKSLGGSSRTVAFSIQNAQNTNFSTDLTLLPPCRGSACLDKISFDQGGGYYPFTTYPEFAKEDPLKIVYTDLTNEHPNYALDYSSSMEIFAVAVNMDKSGNNNNVIERINHSPAKATGLRIILDKDQANPNDPFAKPPSSLSMKIGRKSNGEFYVDCGPLGDNL